MKKLITLASMVMLMGMGCSVATDTVDTAVVAGDGEIAVSPESPRNDEAGQGEVMVEEQEVRLPLDEHQLTYKGFGEYIEDRFLGYHVGIDLEAQGTDVPVYAVADGEVLYVDWVSGYGGVVLVRHDLLDVPVTAIYGHLDRGSIDVAVKERVKRGDRLAVLGEGGTAETDGERTHLHFALYDGEEIRLQGYEGSVEAVNDWLNPQDFFETHAGLDLVDRDLSELTYVGAGTIALDFDLPAGWDIEWIPSLAALSLYELSGEGVARERSQVLIRYFDASKFLTLSTVEIYEATDMTVGNIYTARRYDIQKKAGVADFADQPSWRNERHIVTDFRAGDGYTRYYVVAAHPELDVEVYQELLASMLIVE